MFVKKQDPVSHALKMGKNATRSIFFVIGYGFAAWAALIPSAKLRLGFDDASLALLIVCLGAGSLITMPITGSLVTRFSCRAVITFWSFILVAFFPPLAFADKWYTMAGCLLVFGGAIGGIDVAANIQGLMIQKESKRLMMSAFHAFYSIGALCGSGAMSAMLSYGLSSTLSSIISAILLFVIIIYYNRHLIGHSHSSEGQTKLALPKGIVVIIGLLCFVTFLAEGVVSDWGGVYLHEFEGFSTKSAGLGLTAFSVAIAMGRIWGDSLIGRMGGAPRVMFIGSLVAAMGFLLIITILPGIWTLIGFFLIGLGCSNIVPIIFTATGKQTAMPINSAVAAVTTMGYSGVLIGPAIIGFLAQATSLKVSFGLVGVLLVLLAFGNKLIFKNKN